jgi:aspartyl-tRNA(Asn)/glutamyl-tRNA(Gln) amidotransferase subunit B
LVDFNRAGVPLIEIVSQPDLRAPAEATAYLDRLKSIVQYLGVCDGNMEQGSLRCDANVSVRPIGHAELLPKTEIKNLNSFRHVQRALEHEIKRQITVLEGGGRLSHETRLWDDAAKRTITMRTKEEAHDYRYFPEPDLPPLVVEQAWLARLEAELPELADVRAARLVAAYGLPEYDAGVLTKSRGLADYYEAVVAGGADPKAASNWVMGELLRRINPERADQIAFPVPAGELAKLIGMVQGRSLSAASAKEVFAAMADEGKTVDAVVEQRGLGLIRDRDRLEPLVAQVVRDHPEPVAQYRGGKSATFGFLVGQVMKATRGQADPELVRELLAAELNRQ